jgi:hypothetical protein
MEIAELHAVGREQRAPGMAVVVDQVDCAGARHDRDHGLSTPGRREGAREAAAVLLVDAQRERHAGEAAKEAWNRTLDFFKKHLQT